MSASIVVAPRLWQNWVFIHDGGARHRTLPCDPVAVVSAWLSKGLCLAPVYIVRERGSYRLRLAGEAPQRDLGRKLFTMSTGVRKRR